MHTWELKMSNEILSVQNLHASYGKVVALKGVSVSVREGEVVAILGANGAGKSTLLNCISGVLRSSAGQVRYRDQEVRGRKPWEMARIGVSHVPEGREIFSKMTVEENLEVVDSFGPGPSFTVAQVLDIFPRLRERLGQYGGNLSGGEQQMLAIGRGLMARPSLILFDEPSLGLSPVLSKMVLATIAKFRTMGIASLLVEQNMRAALRIADRAYVLRVGEIVKEGEAQRIAADEDIRSAYLGS